jgi:sugar phosphate isomerase/epimerase
VERAIVSNVKIGIQTRSLRQPLKQAIQTAARLGAEGIEVDARSELVPAQMSQTAVRQFRKLLGDLNLRVSAVSFLTRRGYDSSDDLERRVLATQAAMKMAHAIGADVVINRVGQATRATAAVSQSASDQGSTTSNRLTDVLIALGTFGDRVGARLAAQTGSESGEQLAELLSGVPDQTIGVDFHPSALIFNGHDPQAALAALGPRVLHVHACDAVRDLSRGQAFEVELGRGSADLPGLLGRLSEFNYRGWVTIERHDSADPIVEIGNAVAFLRSL